MNPRAARLAAAALTGLLVLGACTALPQTTPKPATTSAPAPAVSSAAPNATPSPAAPQPGQTVAVDAFVARLVRGATSFKTASITLVTDVAAAKIDAKGFIDQTDPAKPKLKLTMTNAGQAMELIMVDGVTYIQAPGSGGKYVKSTTTAVAADQMSPAAQALAWKLSLKKVTFISKETISGQPTDHYQFTVTSNGVDTTVDNWIDAQDRPVQSQIAFTGGVTTVTYGNFDAPVTITAPAPDQIANR